jgi:hemolysin activation/secretion protein
MSAKATLRPGSAYGTSDLMINADENRLAGGMIVDNYGRENIGENRATLTGSLNNPLSYGDQVQLLYLYSQDGLLKYGYLGYNAPLGYSGLRGEVSYAQANFSAEIAGLSGTNVDGKNKTARAGLDWPLTLTREGGTSLSVAVTNQKSNADIAGVKLTNEINLTVLELGVAHSHIFGSLAVYQAQLTAASNGKSSKRADCDSAPPDDCNRQLLRLEGDLQYVQPLIGRFDVFTHFNGVYSPDPLPPVSPFSIGGPNSVRAYPTSEERGDSGVFGTFALRYGILMGAVQSQLRVFSDSGTVMRIDPGPGTTDQDSLSSYGIGTDIFWRTNSFRLSGKVDLSFPVDNHPPSDGKDNGRLYASISAGF